MVLVEGKDSHPWQAKIVGTQEQGKNYQGFFSEEDLSRPG